MLRPYCWILLGLPASGKSTWRNEMFRNYPDVVILSTDDIIEKYALANNKTYNEIFKDYIDTATTEMFQQFKKAIKEKKNIVIDRTNLTVKSRAKFLSQLPKEYVPVAIVFECHPDILVKRLVARPGKSIPDHVMEDMKSRLEMPSSRESFDSITMVLTDKDGHVWPAQTKYITKREEK